MKCYILHLLLLITSVACKAQVQSAHDNTIAMHEDVSVKQFKYRGDDSGYVIRDSVIVGYIGKYVQRDWTYKYRGRIQNLDRIYYNVYDRTHKLIATVERQRYKKDQFRVRVSVLHSDKTFSFADVPEEKVLPTSAKMLLADNILW